MIDHNFRSSDAGTCNNDHDKKFNSSKRSEGERHDSFDYQNSCLLVYLFAEIFGRICNSFLKYGRVLFISSTLLFDTTEVRNAVFETTLNMILLPHNTNLYFILIGVKLILDNI